MCVCSHTVYDNVSMYWTSPLVCTTIVGTGQVRSSCNGDMYSDVTFMIHIVIAVIQQSLIHCAIKTIDHHELEVFYASVLQEYS